MIDVASTELLRACLLDGKAGRDAFSAWKAYANPESMEGRHLRLMPLLYRNLQRIGVDDAAMPWLSGLAKHTWLTASLRLAVVLGQIAALNDAGIPVVLIKGAALVARWPREIDTRVSGDVDFFVPPNRALDTLQMLKAAGWTVHPPEFVSAIDLRKFHSFDVLHSHNLWMDVHWRPSAAVGDPALGKTMLARSVTAKLNGKLIRVADLADHFFILLAQAFFDAAEARVDWVAEAAFILQQHNAQLDWALFDNLVRKYRLDDWRRRALNLVETVAGIAVPRAAFGKSFLRAGRWFERREYMARAKRIRSPVDEFLCQLGDVSRGRTLRQIFDPGVLSQAAHLPMLRHRLSPAVCLRLIKHGETRPSELALIPSHGLDLSREPPGSSFLSGWSIGESIGRWTDGQAAWAVFRVPDDLPNSIRIRLMVGTTFSPTAAILTARTWAGGELSKWDFGPGLCWGEHRTTTGGVHNWAGARVLPLFIEFDGPMDPESRGRTDADIRSLGVLLSRIEFAHVSNIPLLDHELDLAETGPIDRMLWSGWSHAEPTGRWTVGQEAQLLLNFSSMTRSGGILRMHLNAVFTEGREASQPVQAFVGGTLVAGTVFRPEKPPFFFDVPLSEHATQQDDLVDVRIRIGRPMSPLKLGLSSDSRELGLMVRRLSLVDSSL